MSVNRTGWHRLSDGSAVWKSGQQCQVEELKEQLAAERAKVALAVEWLSALGKYEAVERHNGDRNTYALSYNGSNDPVVSLDPRYDAFEAFEDFAKWLKAESAKALAALQSSDALADIRREVARECAEFAHREESSCKKEVNEVASSSIAFDLWEARQHTAYRIKTAIRTKFGVAE